MKHVFLWLSGVLLGSLVMFCGLWSVHYTQKHPYRPHFPDTNDVELIFLFEQRYADWMSHVQHGENTSSQWNELRRMGEILEEIKHRKVGDMDDNDSLYEAEKKKAESWVASRQSPGI